MAKSIIFLTTPTSATASMWRILSMLASETEYELNRYTDSFYLSGKLEDLKNAIPPEEDNIILFNTPQLLNQNLDLSKYRFIINARDPRDISCNQYFWALQHPSPIKSEEELAKERENIKSNGIDQYVINKDNAIYYKEIISVTTSNNIINDDKILASYALLCINFDIYIERLAKFLNIELTQDLIEKLSPERTDNLSNNKDWIGKQWSGSDILPGRYKKELKKETIDLLNSRYEEILLFLHKYDEHIVKETYLIE